MSGEEPKYPTMGNYCSQTFMDAKRWHYEYMGGGTMKFVDIYIHTPKYQNKRYDINQRTKEHRTPEEEMEGPI
jgi:hypothetical protein